MINVLYEPALSFASSVVPVPAMIVLLANEVGKCLLFIGLKSLLLEPINRRVINSRRRMSTIYTRFPRVKLPCTVTTATYGEITLKGIQIYCYY